VDLIFEGRLSDQINMKDVLLRIKSNPTPGLKILRINRQRDGLNGKIAIDAGKYVTAASVVDSVESGYPALRLLLTISDGNFALLNAMPNDSIELQPNLHIGLDQLLQAMPHLPDSPAKLFDERALLDKVFGQDFTLGDLPAHKDDEDEEEPVMQNLTLSGPNKVPDKMAWALMQPLIDDQSFSPGMVDGEEIQETPASRNPRKTLTGSPALRQSEYLSKEKPEESSGNMPFIAIGIILVVVLAIGVALSFIK
jgi:hypothetical protein